MDLIELKLCIDKVLRLSYIFLFFLNLNAQAQETKKLEILNANYTYYDQNVNPDIRRLVDSVVFIHRGTTMQCDSAWYYYKENKFEAFSNIHIKSGDTLHLTGNQLNYNGLNNVAAIFGNVKLQDSKMTLKTEKLNYDLLKKVAFYINGAHITSENNTLVSKIGQYNSLSKSLYFEKNVEINNPRYIINSSSLDYYTNSEIAYFLGPTTISSNENQIYCENGWYDTKNDLSQYQKNAKLYSKQQILSGDSLFYDRNNGYGLALNEVEIIDTIEGYSILGNKIELFESNDSSIVTKRPEMRIYLEKDTLFLHGDTINAHLDESGQKMVEIYSGVKFYSKDIQGKSFYINYYNNDSTIRMIQDPVIWSNEYQITGNEIWLLLKNDELSQLKIDKNPFVVSHSKNQFYNQITGKRLYGYFLNNKMHNIKVFGNGQTSYVLEDDQNKIIGVNAIKCSDISIMVHNNKISKISFLDMPDKVYYPPSEVPNEWLQLKGFTWRIDERILERKDIF